MQPEQPEPVTHPEVLVEVMVQVAGPLTYLFAPCPVHPPKSVWVHALYREAGIVVDAYGNRLSA